ncbi:hypothetical protein BDB00DRAFT_834999, partial [Zychaea mexicana]|uniref:uncharacterized protein n=1 Tax=Zychaea mexicana TaxID=64656 RepID=UPI0022FF05EA
MVIKSGYLSSVAFSLLFPLSPCFSISRSRNRHKRGLKPSTGKFLYNTASAALHTLTPVF